MAPVHADLPMVLAAGPFPMGPSWGIVARNPRHLHPRGPGRRSAMARPKVKDEKAPADAVPRRDKESEAEAQLRAYHALGRKVLARIKEGPLDAATLRALDEETG